MLAGHHERLALHVVWLLPYHGVIRGRRFEDTLTTRRPPRPCHLYRRPLPRVAMSFVASRPASPAARPPRGRLTSSTRKHRPRLRSSGRVAHSTNDDDGKHAGRGRFAAFAAGSSRGSPTDAPLRPLPQTVTEEVEQCAEMIAAASRAGIKRQRIELLLPINQRRTDFNLTDGDDYGDNNDAVYKAAMETASAVIRIVDPDGGGVVMPRGA